MGGGGGGGAPAPFPYPLCQTIDQYISHPPPVKASSCTIENAGTYELGMSIKNITKKLKKVVRYTVRLCADEVCFLWIFPFRKIIQGYRLDRKIKPKLWQTRSL